MNLWGDKDGRDIDTADDQCSDKCASCKGARAETRRDTEVQGMI